MSESAAAGLRVRRFVESDWNELIRLSMSLFPHEREGHERDMRVFLERGDGAVFVVERPDGKLAGYVEAGTRPYADGCETTPVGYIEAWYVDADARLGGWGRRLLEAAEDWARGRGYREMASDAVLDNEVSHKAHRRSGYEEVDRVIQYRKFL